MTTYPCGCEYEETPDGKMLVRVKECDRHFEKRTRKRPYRPKSEAARSGGMWD